MKWRQITSLAFLFCCGCATTATTSAPMDVVRGGCRAVELRPSWLSTGTVMTCWDADGKVIAAGAVTGTPRIQIPLAVVDAAATVGGAWVLGSWIDKAFDEIDHKHSFDVPDINLPDASDFESLLP